MTPEQLRASILKAAFEGKLVEQIEQEKTVHEEIEKLGIKIDKIEDDEIEDKMIPSSWTFIKLKDLVSICTGKKDANYGSPCGKYDFFTCSAGPIKSNDYSYDGEYLIMPGNGANIGRVIYYKGKFEAYQRTYLLENIYSIDMLYLKYHLESNWKSYNADKMYGSAIPYIKLGNLQNYIVSFPTLEEQHRIVAKIEELLSYVDRYAEAYEKLEWFNGKFPEDMKKSILQYAIQGKLVEQRLEEGTAEELYQQIQEEKQKLIKEGEIKKEKALAEITEDEIPFEIPKSWEWIRLGTIISLQSGQDLKPSEYNSLMKGIPYLTGASNIENNGNIVINRWTDTPKAYATKGDLLLTCKGTVGKLAFLDEEKVHIARQIMAIKSYSMDSKFIRYYLETQISDLKGMAKSMIPGIERENVLKLVFPLPPLEEQHRIVSKIEELLPYCDKLANKE